MFDFLVWADDTSCLATILIIEVSNRSVIFRIVVKVCGMIVKLVHKPPSIHCTDDILFLFLTIPSLHAKEWIVFYDTKKENYSIKQDGKRETASYLALMMAFCTCIFPCPSWNILLIIIDVNLSTNDTFAQCHTVLGM